MEHSTAPFYKAMTTQAEMTDTQLINFARAVLQLCEDKEEIVRSWLGDNVAPGAGRIDTREIYELRRVVTDD